MPPICYSSVKIERGQFSISFVVLYKNADFGTKRKEKPQKILESLFVLVFLFTMSMYMFVVSLIIITQR